jgi:pilus assembly protein CpaE
MAISSPNSGNRPRLSAILIAPDRQLARQFTDALAPAQAFQIAAEMKAYPALKALEVRLDQVRPDVLLLDLATDLEAACSVIREAAAHRPGCKVIGLHRSNDSEAILKSLRTGATEFLHAPFQAASQLEAAQRIERLLHTAQPPSAMGQVIVFTSAKEGSGATTLAREMAYALRAQTRQRVLLADFDAMGGTLAFTLNAIQDAASAGAGEEGWLDGDGQPRAAEHQGVSLIANPQAPPETPAGGERLQVFLESARQGYDWVLADLPPVFERISLLAISEADQAYLLATPELPSLHLARKAVSALRQLGFPPERFRVVLNRVDRRGGLAAADIEKLFPSAVQAKLPNDPLALQRAIAEGAPVNPESDFGRAASALAAALAGELKKKAIAEAAAPAAGGAR